jgi:hypothetical protein
MISNDKRIKLKIYQLISEHNFDKEFVLKRVSIYLFKVADI